MKKRFLIIVMILTAIVAVDFLTMMPEEADASSAPSHPAGSVGAVMEPPVMVSPQRYEPDIYCPYVNTCATPWQRVTPHE